MCEPINVLNTFGTTELEGTMKREPFLMSSDNCLALSSRMLGKIVHGILQSLLQIVTRLPVYKFAQWCNILDVQSIGGEGGNLRIHDW